MTNKTIGRQQLIRRIGQRTRLSNKVTAQVLECLIDILTEEIAAGSRVEFQNFLTLEVQTRTRSKVLDAISDKPEVETIHILKCRTGKHLRAMIKQLQSQASKKRP